MPLPYSGAQAACVPTTAHDPGANLQRGEDTGVLVRLLRQARSDHEAAHTVHGGAQERRGKQAPHTAANGATPASLHMARLAAPPLQVFL